MSKKVNVITIFHVEATNKIIEFAKKVNVKILPITGAWLCLNTETVLSNDVNIDLMPEFIIDENNFNKFTTEVLISNEIQLRSEANGFNRFSIKMGENSLYFNVYKNCNYKQTNGVDLPVNKIWERSEIKEDMYWPIFEDAVLSYFWRVYHHLYKKNGQDEIQFLKSLVSLSNIEKLYVYSKDYKLQKFTKLIIKKAKRKEINNFVINSKINNYLNNKTLKKIIIKLKCSDEIFSYGISSLRKVLLSNFQKYFGYFRSRLVSTFAKTYIVKKEIGTKENEFRLLRRLNAKKNIKHSVKGEYLLSTSSGLWYLKENKLIMIVPGGCFGITGGPEEWYLCQYTGDYSRILKFTLSIKDGNIFLLNRTNYLTGLPPNIHQVDLFDGKLYIVNAADNSIIVSSKEDKYQEFFPNGKIKKGSSKSNHFNSVFIKDSTVYLMAHNGTSKNERNSEIFKVDKTNMKKRSIIKINAQKAHNIFFLDGKLGYCNSPKGELVIDNHVVYKNSKYFLRGVAMNSENIVVGGSEFATRENRDKTSSMLFELDLDGTLVNEIFLQDIGQIYDVRCIGNDLGMSQNCIINE